MYSKKIRTILIEYASRNGLAYPMTVEQTLNAVVEYLDKRVDVALEPIKLTVTFTREEE